MRKQVIGILGGMGPEASSYLYKKLIDLSIKYFGAKNNNDFPEIVLYSVPVPDFISDNNNRMKALQMLKEKVKAFNGLNISYLAIACNTVHILLNDLQSVSKAPFISMIEEVAKTVCKSRIKKVGILGTQMTIKERLYESSLDKFGIESIIPADVELRALERVIRNVISGLANSKDKIIVSSIANNLVKRGAEGIILGCTEMPLIFPEEQELPVFNSLEILAMSLLRNYYK